MALTHYITTNYIEECLFSVEYEFFEDQGLSY